MKIIRKKEEVKIDIFDAIPRGSLFTLANDYNNIVYMKIEPIHDINGDLIANVIMVEKTDSFEAGRIATVEPYFCKVIRFEGAFVKDYKCE